MILSLIWNGCFYLRNQDRCWKIKADDPNLRIGLQFKMFHTEGPPCTSDYLEIEEGEVNDLMCTVIDSAKKRSSRGRLGHSWLDRWLSFWQPPMQPMITLMCHCDDRFVSEFLSAPLNIDFQSLHTWMLINNEFPANEFHNILLIQEDFGRQPHISFVMNNCVLCIRFDNSYWNILQGQQIRILDKFNTLGLTNLPIHIKNAVRVYFLGD